MDVIPGQQKGEFLAADTGCNACFCQVGYKECCHTLEGTVTFLYAVELVVHLEIIQIDETEGKGSFLIFFEFRIQKLEEILPVDQTGQLVLSGIIDGTFICSRIVQRRGTNRADGLDQGKIERIVRRLVFLFREQKNPGDPILSDHGNKVIRLEMFKHLLFFFPHAAVNCCTAEVLQTDVLAVCFEICQQRMVGFYVEILFFKRVVDEFYSEIPVSLLCEYKQFFNMGEILNGIREILENIADIQHLVDFHAESFDAGLLHFFRADKDAVQQQGDACKYQQGTNEKYNCNDDYGNVVLYTEAGGEQHLQRGDELVGKNRLSSDCATYISDANP